jgi:hypothetical protein
MSDAMCPSRSAFCVLWLTCVLSAVRVTQADPPRVLRMEHTGHDPTAPSGTRVNFAILRMPGGEFAFYDRARPSAEPLQLRDREGNVHTLGPGLPPEIAGSTAIRESGVLNTTQVILTPDESLVSVFVKGEAIDAETAKKVGLPRYLDVWVHRCGLQECSDPERIWRGYNGSQMEYEQLPTGRILVPYGSFQPFATPVPPTGRHKVIVQYSDDGARTWTESPSQLVAPCYPLFNGNNEGACEPAIERLVDGRIWMLMRTQAGFLYESFSSDEGTTWQTARASRFNTSTGPPNILRHPDGWLIVAWNNCEMPPRHEGQGVYGGRDALHIAVSDDDGRTWRGFREIYLDHRRHDNPAKSGDRGTAYPLGAYDSEGRIVMLAGQGAGGRQPILIDLDWIVATSARTDFSDGLAQWSVYKHHGPAQRWWRARAVGGELVPHPNDPDARCLHLRRPDDLPSDGATWNFPNGWNGSLTARVMHRAGSEGAIISLNDRMFDPTNDEGERLAAFAVSIAADGRCGTQTLEADRWYNLTLSWDLGSGDCRLQIDGQDAGSLPLRHPTLNGLSYVRFRSAADQFDPAGLLIDSVVVEIDAPYAPAVTPQQQAQHERRYVETVVSEWR